MFIEKVNLRNENLSNGQPPSVTAYILDKGKYPRPAVIVFPGGGYAWCSPSEGERIAIAYSSAGFNTFVVRYALAPNRHPEPIMDAAHAIRFVRENAEKYDINPNQIAIIGFSAGGHLAASISTLWNDPELFSQEEIESQAHKPNAAILSYPVITSGEFISKASFKRLLGEDASEEQRSKMSLETRVGSHTPPTFLWHTFTDQTVPVENSLLYAMALSKHNVPCELHVYPNGPHGLSRVSDDTLWAVNCYRRKLDWLGESIEWMIDLFELKLIK